MHGTYIDRCTNLVYILSTNSLFFAVKAHLADENETGLGIRRERGKRREREREKESRFLTAHQSLVVKSFINNLFITKSRDRSCDCLTGSTSRPYNKIGIDFVDTSWRITSSDAICLIFPKILFCGI